MMLIINPEAFKLLSSIYVVFFTTDIRISWYKLQCAVRLSFSFLCIICFLSALWSVLLFISCWRLKEIIDLSGSWDHVSEYFFFEKIPWEGPNKLLMHEPTTEERIVTFSGPYISHMIERVVLLLSLNYISLAGIPNKRSWFVS